MKKLILLLIALSMLVCLFACEKPDGEIEKNGTKEDEKLENFENDGNIEFWIYRQDHGSGFGNISTKTCNDVDESYALVAALHNAKETGEITEKISNQVITSKALITQYPVEFNTVWIVSSVGLYRMPPDHSQIYRVETHFGEGKVLEMTDELKTAIEGAWNYSPYYSYSGTYTAGDETVELKVTNESDSPIRMSVKNIHIESGFNSENTITMELTSAIDCEVSISFISAQSDDNIGTMADEVVRLKKDVPENMEFTFGGFDYTYWLNITAGYTKAVIKIDPRVKA